jgi:hypothetical protein
MKPKIHLAFILLITVATSIQLIPNQFVPSANPNCTVANCQQCLTIASTCDLCDNSFYLQDNACLTCVSAIQNCQECTFDPSTTTVTCTLCSAGFVVTGQTCTSCSLNAPHCTTCRYDQVSATVTCTACAAGYYLQNGQCL